MELQKLQTQRTTDPHSVLGVHPSAAAFSLRVYRPDAASVKWLKGTVATVMRPRTDVPGLFEAALTEKPTGAVSCEAHLHTGQTVRFVDPYSFWPTLGERDLHFFGEGTHQHLWKMLGARPITHQGTNGTAFSVWAPNALGVAVVGSFNSWDGRVHQMRALGSSGVWEIFIPNVAAGALYKFELQLRSGVSVVKADPMARRTEVPPLTASVVCDETGHDWRDGEYLLANKRPPAISKRISIYEVHFASWKRVPEQNNRSLTYREAATELAEYAVKMGFTHIEFLPMAEHPFGGSWGYQVTSYYAPTSRFGSPDDFKYLVDTLHAAGIGVIIDWVPGHFPKDAFALAQFDGTALYEHADPRKGAHPDWGTLIFNFSRNEVRNFLIANALYWLEEFHVDGLRVDAVASMLYLDYSRAAGEWIPNDYGGRENTEAIAFMRQLNDTLRARHPGALVMAEESTSWPQVSGETKYGGLGFTHKWNMGWMHDTLQYFEKDPLYRNHHHHQLTFGLVYAYSEKFVLPLSHDEVVHGKKSLLGKMPGDDWQKFANLRALYGLMWAHPGRKLLFMGAEIAQWSEWNHDSSLDWHLLQRDHHAGVQKLVATLNHLSAHEGALFENDDAPAGFQWVQVDAADANVLAFIRRGRNAWKDIVCIANLSPVVRYNYRVGVPAGGFWSELLNTDDGQFGGSNVRNGLQNAIPGLWNQQPGSIEITLPPLSVMWWGQCDDPRLIGS